jgi:cell division protein FtsQ
VRAASAVVTFPPPDSSRDRSWPVRLRRGARGDDRLELNRFVPSGRSVLVGLALLLAGCGAYAVARSTSAFAVRTIEVDGPPVPVAHQVAEVLARTRGESLVGIDLPHLQALVEEIPGVASVTFDRAFPHTLRASVVPERPVAVLRQGKDSWLVAASGRVIRPLERGARRRLPRIWLPREVELRVGARVPPRERDVVRVIAPLARAPLPARVVTVRHSDDELTLVLRSGAEVRLGDQSDRALKLELARRILPLLTAGERYLDVSVPERPVAGSTLDSQVEVELSTSTLR